jgi:tetratricopeptide (TPR) repeat protein
VTTYRFNRLLPSKRTAYLLSLILSAFSLFAQPGTRIDLPKPEKFQNRVLKSEKTGEGGIPFIKRFQQNIVTKYNFHFNAENELNDVISSVRQAHKDDYTRMLSFFDHSPQEAAGQKEELDSVILKCNNGILLHDLRNDWVDDLYLLMGRAYFLRNELDSALFAFQYINYSFQPRTKDEYGYEKTIGSRMDGGGDSRSISTPEKKGLLPRVLLHTPVRNDAILWLLRTLIEQNRLNEAGGLIEILRSDKQMPARLRDGLSEMQALWFYRNEQYDSAAHYLEKSLDLAEIPGVRARREFLAAQMYSVSGNSSAAGNMYEKVIIHTTDPVMEAYARINRMNLPSSAGDSVMIRRNLDELLSMARKSRYEEYRHIIYYAAAKLEMQRHGYSAAMAHLRNSISANNSDPALKNKAFLELGNLAFVQRDYPLSANSYDSIQADGLTGADSVLLTTRKPLLRELVTRLEQFQTEDSLQKIADMPEAERAVYVRTLSRKLRKAQGLKEEELPAAPSAMAMPGGRDNEPVNLFATNESKGEWYFYNAGLRNQGLRQFSAKWGKRPNIDNWRRLYAVNAQLNAAARGLNPPDMDPDGTVSTPGTQTAEKAPQDLSEDGMLSRLPLTEEMRKASNDTIQAALFSLGRLFREELDDCEESIRYLSLLLDRFPTTNFAEQALYQLSVCFKQRGDASRSAFYRNHLARIKASSPLLGMIDDPGRSAAVAKDEQLEASGKYELVYDRMISGKFQEAFELKRAADSSYGSRYWTDQLLYIEAIYHVSRQEDSIAIQRLEVLANRKGQLAGKATTMMDVIKKRKEIEEYLTKLDIKRYPEDSIILPEETIPQPPPKKIEPNVTPVVQEPQQAAVPVQPPVVKSDSSLAVKQDTLTKLARIPGSYHYEPTDAQVVVLLLDQVDPVYRNEARVGLNGYNRSQFADLGLTIRVDGFNDDIRLLLIEGFSNMGTAITYIEQVRKASPTEIFPWMPADRYRYFPVSVPDLPLFLEKKDERGYLEFLRKHLPGKF